MKKFILLALATIILSGCVNYTRFHPGGRSNVAPAGPKIYQQGYLDGCESGKSGYKGSLRKMYWSWKQNPKLAQNRVYYKIWKDAYAYCAIKSMMEGSHGLGNWR